MTEFSKSSEEPILKPEEVESAGESAPQPQAEKTAKLSQPSRELATRLLRRVSFKERLIGFRSNPGPGDLEESIYSFEEASFFLDGGDLTGMDWVNSIPFNALKKWVGETLGDKELALAIGEIASEVDKAPNPFQEVLKRIELIPPVKALMKQRLEQCEEVLGIVREETEA